MPAIQPASQPPLPQASSLKLHRSSNATISIPSVFIRSYSVLCANTTLTNTDTHTWMHTNAHILHIHIHMHKHTQMHTQVHTHKCTGTHKCTNTHVYMHTQTRTDMSHISTINTRTYKRTHTCTFELARNNLYSTEHISVVFNHTDIKLH